VDWRRTRADEEMLLSVCSRIGRALADSGAGRLRSQPELVAEATGGHHIGTTRMSVSPTAGVVDENCRVHDVRNLYVASSSVFPTCSYANPTLLILSLALRLADHLSH
jgi:choline dehydrogenase-like flavoprotein